MSVRLAADAGELAAAYDIRARVFVGEQGVPLDLERDELDGTADHLLALVGGEPAGTVRLVVEATGPYAGAAHLGRLAVLPAARGLGLGVALTRAVEARARERGLPEVVLTAQVEAVGFYERLGYAAEGPVFDDAGLPHRLMRRSL